MASPLKVHKIPHPGGYHIKGHHFEWIWLVAVAVAATTMLVANPALNHAYGSNWPHYFESAQFFWNPESAYFDWRTPMYPYLLATLGQHLGFVFAAQLIAQVSTVALVFSAGLLARAMVNPVAGAIAALSVPGIQCAVESATWSNMYPPAAAAFGLAVALGAVTLRRPSPISLGLATLFAALAWRFNHLGLLAMPMTLGLCALGVVLHVPRGRWPMLGLIAALGLAGPIALDRWIVETYQVPQASLEVQVLQRRREELDRIAHLSDDQTLFPGCTDFVPKPLNVRELTNACAIDMLKSNWGTLEAEDCAPPPFLLLWLLPGALLPAGWAKGRRWAQSASSLAAIGLVAAPAAAIYLGASWTNYSEKYMLAFIPILVLLTPLAGARLGSWIGRAAGHATLGRGLGLLAAGLLAAMIWPRPAVFHADAPRITRTWETISAEATTWTRANMQASDLLIDCVPLRVDLALLPDAVPYRFGVGTEDTCRQLIAHPPTVLGRTYLLHRTFDQAPMTQPDRIGRQGWEIIQSFGEGYYLWRRTHTSPKSPQPTKSNTPTE
jgi:hypothetical protein